MNTIKIECNIKRRKERFSMNSLFICYIIIILSFTKQVENYELAKTALNVVNRNAKNKIAS